MLKIVDNRNTVTRCQICSKLTTKTINEHTLNLVLVFLLLTLNRELGEVIIGTTAHRSYIFDWFSKIIGGIKIMVTYHCVFLQLMISNLILALFG